MWSIQFPRLNVTLNIHGHKTFYFSSIRTMLCYNISYLLSSLSLSLSLSLSTLSFKLIENFLTLLHWWKYLCPKIHISYTLLISFLIYNYLHLNVTWKHSLLWFDRISDHNFLCTGMKIASDWAQFKYQNILQWNIHTI